MHAHFFRPINGVLKPEKVTPTNPLPVAIATGDGASDTGASTAVASSTSAGTLKAANTARIGLTIYNDDANTLYVLLGAGTVSASLYTVAIPESGYYEVPYGFTGIVTGVWAGDGTGSARVTEIS